MAIKISRTRLDFGAVGMKNYAESVNALGNVTGVTNIDYSLGSVVTATTIGVTTWNVTNPPSSGKTGSLTLILTNGGTRTQSWMSGTKWPSGIAPTLSANGIDVLNFFTTDGGSTWRGMLSIPNIPLSVAPANRLFAWGMNDSIGQGQLGDSTVVNKSSPVQVGTLTDWISISAGFLHSLAIKSNNTLWAWGFGGSYGNFGDSTVGISKSSPIQVGTLTDWSSVAAGSNNSLARKTDGSIWSWGRGDTFGALGDSTKVSKSSPVKIGTLTDWASVSIGGNHSVARKTDGTIWAWGLGTSGQLGDNTAASKSSPVKIGTLTDWASVSAGGLHAHATKTDGTLWAWGYNIRGQLGDGTVTTRSSPVKIGTLSDWASVSAGREHSLARKTDGTIWSWGINTYGQLGDNTAVSKSSPVQIGTLTDWASVSGGMFHSFASKTNNSIWTWGRNNYGQLGDNTVVVKSSPIQVGTLTDWTSISFGPYANNSFGIK